MSLYLYDEVSGTSRVTVYLPLGDKDNRTLSILKALHMLCNKSLCLSSLWVNCFDIKCSFEMFFNSLLIEGCVDVLIIIHCVDNVTWYIEIQSAIILLVYLQLKKVFFLTITLSHTLGYLITCLIYLHKMKRKFN